MNSTVTDAVTQDTAASLSSTTTVSPTTALSSTTALSPPPTLTSNGGSSSIVILRIKRKRCEDPIDTLLVAQAGKDKKLKAVSDARVFKLLESVDYNNFDKELPTNSTSTPSTGTFERLVARLRNSPRVNRLATVGNRKEVLASSKLAEAKAARYRVVEQSRKSFMDGALNWLLTLGKYSDMRDDIVCNLLPMVREYLNLSEGSSLPPPAESLTPATPATVADDVYDLYYYDEGGRVGPALESSKVATLGVQGGDLWDLLINDPDTSSEDDVDSEDSNEAEDHYANDYPDEEDDDEFIFEESYDSDSGGDSESYGDAGEYRRSEGYDNSNGSRYFSDDMY
ncbi:hypothetical protein BSLG_000770 [Batrachochytrium salamandrivorans]|nr:hypothetical protein BSLG_000770 [Batrachochytrium salamandrivorans]